MRTTEVDERVGELASCAETRVRPQRLLLNEDDPEAARPLTDSELSQMEVGIYMGIASSIALGTCEDPAGCCAAALSSRFIDFPRVYEVPAA